MAAMLFLYPADETGFYRWELWQDQTCLAEGDRHSPAEIIGSMDSQDVEITLVAPAVETALYRLYFSPDERRHLKNTAPYLLEEKIATNVDQLHFALGDPEEDNVMVAVLERVWLQQQLAELTEANLQADFCIPEQQLLAPPDEGWACRVDNGQLMVHTARGRGLICGTEIASAVLEMLAEEEFPAEIRLVGDDRALADFRQVVPETMRDTPLQNSPRLPPPSPSQKKLLNLLQGEFSKKISWHSIWQEWSAAAIMLFGIALIYTGAAATEYRELGKEQGRLQNLASQLMQKAYPEEPMLALAALGDRLSEEQILLQDQQRRRNSNFVRMLRIAGDAIRTVPDTIFKRITYNNREQKLLMEFETLQFSNIQKVRDQLQILGVASKLLNSDSRKGKFLVRVEFIIADMESPESKNS